MKIGFACKWIDRPDQVNGIKPKDECKRYNTGATTVAWLNRQTREVAEQKLWDLMKQNVKTVITNPKIALGIPRGHGKTTLIKLFIVYCILFTDRKFILVMSATATLAENIIADVIDMLNEKNIINC